MPVIITQLTPANPELFYDKTSQQAWNRVVRNMGKLQQYNDRNWWIFKGDERFTGDLFLRHTPTRLEAGYMRGTDMRYQWFGNFTDNGLVRIRAYEVDEFFEKFRLINTKQLVKL